MIFQSSDGQAGLRVYRVLRRSRFGLETAEKIELVMRPPTEEVVTEEDLAALFEVNAKPVHYIGLEVSGFLHLGSLVSTGYKINDLIRAGVSCTVFLADWHTLINEKLGGSLEDISKVSRYYADAFRAVCPGVQIRTGTELYSKHPSYWTELVKFARHMSLARTMRTLTIMGRNKDDKKIDLAKLLYPAMQAADIHFLDVDIAHAGTDQRKIHMLVRENFPRMGWKVPVALHHMLLPGLARPDNDGASKMSKTNPNSGIFMHDTEKEIRAKVSKAWCEEGSISANPLLEIARQIIFHENAEMRVERPVKFGGNASYHGYKELEAAFAAKKLHPSDLKRTVADYLVPIITGMAQKTAPSEEVLRIIRGKN